MSDDFEMFKKRRTQAKASITRISNWVQVNINQDVDSFEFSYKKDKLIEAMDEYNEVQREIELLFIEPNEELLELGTDKEDRDIVEKQYCLCLSKLNKVIKASDDSGSSSSGSVVSQNRIRNCKLPELQIPKFDGNLLEWTHFYNSYKTLILDDNSLSKFEKFMYLKCYLKGEPKELLEALEPSDHNFDTALDLLKTRYDDKTAIINAHLRGLLENSKFTKCTSQNLRDFVVNGRKHLDTILNLNVTDKELWNLYLLHAFAKNIDIGTLKGFEQQRDGNVIPTVNEFFDFLDKKAKLLERLDTNIDSKPPRQPSRRYERPALHGTGDGAFKIKCLFCNKDGHKLASCFKFKNLPHEAKLKYIYEKKLCKNCFSDSHLVNACTLQGCATCSFKHHNLLHISKQKNPPPNGRVSDNTSLQNNSFNSRNNISPSASPATLSPPQPDAQVSNVHVQAKNTLSLSAISAKNNHVLLGTAVTTLYSSKGVPITVKLLLDNCAQNSFITEELVKSLGYEPYNYSLNISGICQSKSFINKMVDIQIMSNVNRKLKFKLSCGIVENITCKLPQIPINVGSLNLPNDIVLADPNFYSPSKIDILIGADLYYTLLCEGIVKLGLHLPCLINTHLGYIIAGNVPSKCLNFSSNLVCANTPEVSQENISLFVHTDSQSQKLDDLLVRFWDMENIPQKAILSADDELAENIFKSTTKILQNGRFQVNLPLKSDGEHQKLGDSFTMAKKRFFTLERRFEKDPNLFLEYKNFIDDYISLGHARYVPLSLHNLNMDNKYFIPHLCVIRPDSVSTKLRVVFDASARTSSGLSLNDVTLKGYQVQPDLFDILCKFRVYLFVLSADIEKMFRQVSINPDQTFLLNILWRNSPQEPLQCIELLTVTYGTNSAPFLATRVLKRLADTKATEYPNAAKALLTGTYMDDILSGSDSEDGLNLLCEELKGLLGSAAFNLHKWCSNSPSFVENTSKISEVDMNLDDCPNKVLGLKWDSMNDSFCISIPSISCDEPITKRLILSTLAQCFDPIGFINPVIVSGKILMQKLWLLKLDWDTEIMDLNILHEWKDIINNLPILNQLKIPRCLLLKKRVLKTDIHGFSDASLSAYGACVYLRNLYSDNTVSFHLISAKSRVAPIKTVSLPRLELSAMVLLSKLAVKIVSIYETDLQISTVNLWSDSKIALAWCSSHASRWNVFVSNRVSEVQELTSKYKWRHIKSSENPADILTRGILPQNLLVSDLWWHGPSLLHNPELELSAFDNVVNTMELPEERKVSLTVIAISDKAAFWYDRFSRFSDFLRLQRSVAYCLRFINNCKNKSQKVFGCLSVDELNSALNLICSILQEKYFSKEISELKDSKVLTNKSILSMKPFMDSVGLIRVGGRLTNADIPYEQKHPVLLPANDYVVSLLLTYEHKRLGHAGPQTVLSNVRLKYWPLNGLRHIKRIIRNCVTCFRFCAQPANQIMSDLPKDRVQMAKPFEKTGIDYGGPFLIKSSRLRKAPLTKCYICMFVCMVTKAVHIEVVSSLSTEAFRQCLKRFISRRGNPSTIFSDNATNFLGAKNELKEIYDFFKDKSNYEDIKCFLSKNEIDFKFICPRSPHWGGLWESAIKSAKFHLKRILGSAHLTFEELYTVLTQVEAIMNSRPLCALSEDPLDLNCLTPGHFLIGRSLSAYPEKDLSFIPENRLSVWQRCTQMQQLFWKRWSVDYLNRLQQRPKWLVPSSNIKINDLALLKEDDTPPLRWPLVRIVKTMAGPDGKVRMVRVKSSVGEYNRPITKICILPVSNE